MTYQYDPYRPPDPNEPRDWCSCTCHEHHDYGEASQCLDGYCEWCGREAGGTRWGRPGDDE